MATVRTFPNEGFHVGRVVFGIQGIFAGNDDSGILCSLGFDFTFRGFAWGPRTWLNENGNLTSEATGQLFVFTPVTLDRAPSVYGIPGIIAAYWADFDSRGDPGGFVRFGQSSIGGTPVWYATWPGSGYYNQRTIHRNRCQIVLYATGMIEFNYDYVTWETGQASGGDANGLGGSSACMGWSFGPTGSSFFYNQPGGRVPGTFLDSGSAPLVAATNCGVPGRFQWS